MKGHTTRRLVALFVFGALALGAVVQAPAATTTRKVKVVIDCTFALGEPNSRCRGTFKMTGQIKGSGKLQSSISKDTGDGGYLRTILETSKGDVQADSSQIRVSNLKRGCAHVASWSLRGLTKSMAGFRGAAEKATCVKVRISGNRVRRQDTFSITLTKRF